jgi:SAM-dependent MidA family methyltransferase
MNHHARASGVQHASDGSADAAGASSDEDNGIGHGRTWVGHRRGPITRRARTSVAITNTSVIVRFYDSTPPPHVSAPTSTLPAPSAEALEHSDRLRQRIRDAIRAAGGWLGFDRYMALALYEPGLGYYAGGSTKFGAAGDFVTAPELSPLFGRTIARPLVDVLATSGGDVLELGPGTGALAAAVLPEMASLGCLPDRYLMLDVSADLRERQVSAVSQLPEELRRRVVWLDALPAGLTGVVLANEVLDALPVHLVEWTTEGCFERGVGLIDDALAWRRGPPVAGALAQAVAEIPVTAPYVSEVGLQGRALVATLAQRLRRGALLFIDYGFGRQEYYHPQRSVGTLMCHHRHHAHADPLVLPGIQDITAHVDFTAVALAGAQQGLSLAGFVTQAHFLVNCGITDLLLAAGPAATRDYLSLSAGVQRLLSPAEMGDLFKVMALTRDLAPPLRGFARGDISRML